MSLIKTDRFAQLLAEYSGVTEEEALSFIKSFSVVVSKRVKDGEDVDVQGLGKFIIIDTKQAEMRRVALMLADSMKDEVNSPFSFFEPYVITKSEVNQGAVESSENEEQILSDNAIVVIEEATTVEKQNPFKEDEVTGKEENTVCDPIAVKEDKEVSTSDDTVNSVQNTKNKNLQLFVFAIVVILLLFVLLYIFFTKTDTNSVVAEENISTENTTIDIVEVQDTIIIDSLTLIQENIDSENLQNKIQTVDLDFVNHRQLDSVGNPVVVVLQSGERLTLVSLKYFGSKDFWPYVYDVNSDRLKSPSNVQTGMKLYLPDKAFFDIDVNNQESLKKARKRGVELINR